MTTRTAPFTGTRHTTDRAKLEARKTNVVRFPDPARPCRFVTARQRQNAAEVIDIAIRRVCKAHGLIPDDAA